jgi:general secretion pathway protein G
MKVNRRGVTLVELLIVVAMIGLIMMIAIPNILNAIQRARQRRTMADMRATASAIESYAIDYKRYPAAASAVSWTISATCTVGAGLGSYIAPTYIASVPLVDGWNSWLVYGTNVTRGHYFIQSGGRNGVMNNPGSVPAEQTTDFNADIILTDGQFTAYPDGAQKN